MERIILVTLTFDEKDADLFREVNIRYLHRVYRKAMERKLGRSLSSGEVVDHVDKNWLNNTRDNLRISTRQQNSANVTRKPNASGYRGVTWHRQNKIYRASISMNGKYKTIGYSHIPEECARMYDRKAIEIYGEFATTNFPKENYCDIASIETPI